MFKEISRKKKYEEVLDQFKVLLKNNNIKVGQRLPNEIELSENLNISRASLREALKVLSIIGIIESKTGEGTIIKKAKPENLQIIMSLVAISLDLQMDELFEVRIILEKSACELAASRRTDEQLEAIHSILVEMDRYYVTKDYDSQTHYDFLFHQSIVRASNNEMLIMLSEITSDLISDQIENTRTEVVSLESVLKRFQKEHWEIFEAIKNKNRELSSHLMVEHLEKSREKASEEKYSETN